MGDAIDEIRWAIIGECGLYTGQYLTRRDAIEEHAMAFTRSDFSKEALANTWRQCKRRGDRAVKVRITLA